MPRKKGSGVKKAPVFRSGFEKKGAKYMKDLGVDFKYEARRIPYTVPSKNRYYVPDFELPNGVIVEFKGKLDRDTREKMLLVVEQNPDLDIRLLFMRNNKLSKQSKTRYSDWCEKHNIKWAASDIGHIPEEWFE